MPQQTTPYLVIDMKRNRIRIHKITLHLLGDPDFVQLLVNPKTRMVAIKCSASNDYLSQKIKWKQISGKQCCELYSKYLMESLHDVCFDWDRDRAYKIAGQLIVSEKLAEFSMDNSIIIEQEAY